MDTLARLLAPTHGIVTMVGQAHAEGLGGLEVAQTTGTEGSYRWRWRGEESDPRALVWRVLWAAASLLRSNEIENVRVCDSEDCGWMFVDRSRNGFRRWCQMRTCGTMEKTRRRRAGRAP